LRAGKGTLYEGGIREPMIIRWPGVAKPGTVCDVPVTSVDFFPTLLEMAGVKPGIKDIDGISLVPLLGGTGKLDRDALYWHYPHYHPGGATPCGAIRRGNDKLLEFYEDNHVELYDLAADIGETKDLAAAMPEKAAALRKQLQDWRTRVKATMPTPNPDYRP
jgi:arylsulfatase A-like enzyme